MKTRYAAQHSAQLVLFLAWILAGQAAGVASGAEDRPFISLEIISQARLATHQQQWMTHLRECGFSNIRIRGRRTGDEPRVINRGTDEAPRLYVTAILTNDNRLALPGVVVRYGDKKALLQWISRLQAGGKQAVTQPRGAYGMTRKQWEALRSGMAGPVSLETRGKSLQSMVVSTTARTGLRFTFAEGTLPALAGGDLIADEYKGVASGTALAAALRTAGLAMVPSVDAAERVVVDIRPAKGAKEIWPVGIKPDKSPGEIAPSLFTFLNTEIDKQPLQTVLEVLQPRIKIPVLIDRNALALEQITLDAPVSFPPKRTFYKRILEQVLFQVKLTGELRIDEANQPFFWVTTARRH